MTRQHWKRAMALAAAWGCSSAMSGVVLDLDARATSSLILDGGVVNSWTDGFASHVFSSTGSQRPSYIADATPNGSAALRFDGSNDRLVDAGFLSSYTNMTVFMVVAPLSNQGGYRSILSGVGSGSADDYISGINIDMGNNSSTTFDSLNVEGAKGGGGGGVDLYSGSQSFGDYSVLTVRYTSPTTQLFVNGVGDGTRAGSGAAAALDVVRIGARYYGNLERGYFNGDIAAIRVYDEALSDSARMAVEAELASQFITPVPEPESYALMLAGLAVLLPVVRRPVKRASP